MALFFSQSFQNLLYYSCPLVIEVKAKGKDLFLYISLLPCIETF